MSREYYDINNLAPVSVTVYTRLNHFRQCIQSLSENTLAPYTSLYIFSDAPKEGDELKVKEVRKYAENIKGFKKIYLYYQDYNDYYNNIFESKDIPIKNHGRVILLEDDIVTAPGFLEFINSALEFYKNDKRVINITGYSPPIEISSDYRGDVFVLPRTCAWGIGFDKRMHDIQQRLINPEVFYSDKFYKKISQAGLDLCHMLHASLFENLIAGDVRTSIHQSINNQFTIYPRRSLVRNIGHDGSGVHCGVNDKYDIARLWNKTSKFTFIQNINLDNNVLNKHYKFRKPKYKNIIVYNLKRLYKKVINNLFLKKVAQKILFKNHKKIIIASSGRCGSTMLVDSISKSLIENHYSFIPEFFKSKVIKLSRDFLTCLDDFEKMNAPILKTHDLYSRKLDNDNCRCIFLFGDPLTSAQSVDAMGRKYGLEWIEKHVQNLGGSSDIENLFQKDILNYKNQLISWGWQNDVLVVHYDDLWTKSNEIDTYLNLNINLPSRKERVKKKKESNINVNLFEELKELEQQLIQKLNKQF